jgi:hypothetical protein
MAEQKSPLSYAQFPNIEPTDISKLNFAGFTENPNISGSIREAIGAQKEYENALEQRFAQPNWFKVAAGFAKPQLGGFMASLGSASEALGENVEQQRMVAPTIAQMRAKTAVMESGLQQQLEIEKEMAAWTKAHPNEPYPPELISKAERYTGENSPLTKSAKSYQGAVRQKLETETGAQRFATESPFYKLSPGAVPSNWTDNAEATRKKLADELVASGKFTPEGVKLMSDQTLLNTSEELQKENAAIKIKNATTAGSVIAGNVQALQDLTTARDLASSDSLTKMLGIGAGQTAVSALFGWVASPTDPSQIGALNKAAAQLAQKDPQAYADFQVLQKTLQKNLADARATIQNPSVGAQNLLSQTQPTVLNSKLAIVKMLDLIAHEKSVQTREGVLRQTYRGRDPSAFESDSAEYKALVKQAQEEKRAIEQSKSAGPELPNFYNPYASLYSQTNAQSTPVTPSPPAVGGNTPARRIRSARDLINEASQ